MAKNLYSVKTISTKLQLVNYFFLIFSSNKTICVDFLLSSFYVFKLILSYCMTCV